MRATVVNQPGGPEVLTTTEIDRPEPGPGQVLVEVAVSGVNFLDVYQRIGETPLQPPSSPAWRGVGVVNEVGSSVTDLCVGQRVGWFSGGQGTFADAVVVAADRAVPLPDDVDDETAAAVLMQGVTAHYLATDTYPIQPGDPVLVHAAAGGVGQLLTQIAKIRGGRVIGTVSTDAKAEVARAAGADETLLYDDFAAQVRALTGDTGVAVVYDGVGATTFDGSLASLRPRGVLVIYGTASGPPPSLDIPRLNTGGSLYVTRPSVAHYAATADELRGRTGQLFTWLTDGRLRPNIGGPYPANRVRDAFAALESRQTTGKVLLIH
jgi:NADPH2:quinone reductase